MKEKLEEIAPKGQIWVCGACGKYDKNRYRVGDVSCFVNSVLCYDDDTLKINNNRVISARLADWKEEDGNNDKSTSV